MDNPWTPSRSIISSAVAGTMARVIRPSRWAQSAARWVDWRAGVQQGVDGFGIDTGSPPALTRATRQRSATGVAMIIIIGLA
jgi:ABC-type sugar transport system substrate-binding protein